MIAELYLHSNKDSMYELGVSLGLTGEALSMFEYTLCEVGFKVEIDEETGLSEIIEVDGRKLKPRASRNKT